VVFACRRRTCERTAWGNYRAFLDYAETLLPIFPSAIASVLATVATVLEVLFSGLLLAGLQLRWTALGSALLLGLFGLCMTLTGGPKPALDFSVWSAAAAALLLVGTASSRNR
jgi:drug/metabolite transporter (DMT)-like permease